MATVNDWIKEAERQAKKYSDNIKSSNQYLIDQLVTNKQNSLNQLEQQNKNDMYNLNTNKATIDRRANENAKQLNIARLMALKDNQETLNRAGLGTQGIVGSQVNSINNSYGTDLTNILNQKSDSMREFEKQKQALLLNYNTNKTNIENEYGTNLANLQQEINNRALSQYNTIYSNYLAQKQQAYENEQAELARQEAIRQYNTNLAYQKEQDKIANAQKLYTLKNQSNNLKFDDTQTSTKSNSILGTFGKLLTNAINNAKSTQVKAPTKSNQGVYNRLIKALNVGSNGAFYTEAGLNTFRKEISKKIEEAASNGYLSESDYKKLCDEVEKLYYVSPQTKSKSIQSKSFSSFGGSSGGSRITSNKYENAIHPVTYAKNSKYFKN